MGSTSDLTPDEVAERILSIAGEGAVLDLGTGASALSRSLRRKGARSSDPAQAAEQGRSEAVGLVTLLDGPDALTADVLDRATAAADRVLVLPPRDTAGDVRAEVAGHLATRSYLRRHDPELVRTAPEAMLFERGEDTPAELVRRYELLVAEVVRSCDAQREAAWDEVVAARHSLLVNRDHVVGTEAEIGRINRDVLRLTQELAQSRKRVRALTDRRDDLLQRVQGLRARLATAQQRNRSLSDRLRRLEQQERPPASPPWRRVARRLAGRRG